MSKELKTKDQLRKEVGKRLKELRLQKGKTQADIAGILGLDRASVSNHEIGRALPKKEELLVLAKFYGTTTDYILGHTDNKETPDPYENEREFLTAIDLSTDEEIKNRFIFEIDGQEVTEEEFKRMVAAVRSERLYRKNP
ncbi:helix-turn-helix domain-containing protein [Paenibacillus humicus]|uniref:helix-turn-helix domain-containing protein n=1 Tax=Paenibacillus humicus TaxID=412861 RepID=UPI0013E36E29|nr:helix-turn-helix transcriptional regulator [Paenibacillus humicus]